MVWGAIAGAAASSLLNRSTNRDMADAAANSTPRFNQTLQPYIEQGLQDVTGFGPREVYEGPRVAGFDPMQTRGFNLAGTTGENLASNADTARQGFQNFAGGNFVGANPYLDQAIQATQSGIFRNMRENALPQVRQTAVGGGGVGGSREAIAEGIVRRGALERAGDVESTMRNQAYQQDMANMLSALQNQGSILSGQTAAPDYFLRTGGVRQAQDQRQIDADRSFFDESQDLDYGRQRDFLSLLLGTPTSSPTMPTPQNPFVAALGGGLLGNQLFPSQPAPAPVPIVGGGTAMPGVNPYAFAP